MTTRREFLKSSALLSLAPTVPAFLVNSARAAVPEKDARALVVVQLDGGNDGLNTVVPFADDAYARLRPTLRVPANRVVKVTDAVGFHPSLGPFGQLLDAGRLAVVQGVGYPNPNRSHFESMAIWQTARLAKDERTEIGWLGLALDAGGKGRGAAALGVGTAQPPVAIRGRRSVAATLDRLDDYTIDPTADPRKALGATDPPDDLTAFVRRSMLDAYATADLVKEVAGESPSAAAYPGTPLGGYLRLIARLLKAGFGTRVYYTIQPGYDTHSGQQNVHANLLASLGGAVKAFLDDLAAAKLADRVAVLIFSEFGRTVRENGSLGTDHGTSGPVFLAGPAVKAGLVGDVPSLTDLDPKHGDLRTQFDFRRVYAAILEGWLGLPSETALGGRFEPLPVLRG
jgi:uncharacterized protein (DUF1501 family)